MKSKLLITKFLEDIVGDLNRLSDSDINKLEEGGYSFSLRIIKDKVQLGNKLEKKSLQHDDILRNLQTCKTRDDGYKMLSEFLNSKKELELFARFRMFRS